MAKVLTLSTKFPVYHPRKGERTYFVEKFWMAFYKFNANVFFYEYEAYLFDLNKHLPYDLVKKFKDTICYDRFAPKHHTARAGHRFKTGELFSPRCWSGKAYATKQIILAPDTEVKKVWDFEMHNRQVFINGKQHCYFEDITKMTAFAQNDGLNIQDQLDWFRYPNPTKDYQIICWNENINY